jgi:hypothetical protein
MASAVAGVAGLAACTGPPSVERKEAGGDRDEPAAAQNEDLSRDSADVADEVVIYLSHRRDILDEAARPTDAQDLLELDDDEVTRYCQGRARSDTMAPMDEQRTRFVACLDAVAELRLPRPVAALNRGQQERFSIVPTAQGDPTWCGPIAAFAAQSTYYRPGVDSHYKGNRADIALDAAALATAPSLPLYLRLYLDDVVVNASSQGKPFGFEHELNTAPEAAFADYFSGLYLLGEVERECPGTAAFMAAHPGGPGVRLGGRGYVPYAAPPGLPRLKSLG